jgi:small subunit ribosomal protein S2
MAENVENIISIKLLLETGAHFGHQTSRWNPKMKKYIYTQRNGIHIIDLEQTVDLLDKACDFVTDIAAQGKDLLFVGTKKQAQETIAEEAERCQMPYVNQRWLGGTLTNFNTIQRRIDHLVRLEERQAVGEFGRLPKKEVMKLEEEISRLNRLLGGVKEMTEFPGALFIVDPVREKIALAEAKHARIPVVALVDTNCNPDIIDYPIPSNDDAIRAIKLICNKIADAVLKGKVTEVEEPGVLGEEAPESEPPMTFSPEEMEEETIANFNRAGENSQG